MISYTASRLSSPAAFGWHYLSTATYLPRPHLFYALFVVSRIIVILHIIRWAAASSSWLPGLMATWLDHPA